MTLRKVLSSHVCSDNHGCGPSIYDLPIPLSLREEWRQLETRRHFLGRMGKTLGWAGLAALMGNGVLRPKARAASEVAAPVTGSNYLPNFVPKAKRCIHLFMSGAP